MVATIVMSPPRPPSPPLGPAARNVFLAAEGKTAVAAVARFNSDIDFVD